jgi:ABC-type phosphate transport system permease subunit
MFSIKHQMQVIPLSRNQRDKQRKKNKRFVSFLFTFCSLLSWFSFVFILFISVHFFTFPAFSFSWKKQLYQSRPLACRPTI